MATTQAATVDSDSNAAECASLALERALAPSGTVDSLAGWLNQWAAASLPGEPASARVFVSAENASLLSAVVEDVSGLAGVTVTGTVDQQAMFDEFVELFGADSTVAKTLSVSDMPVAVAVETSDDAALQALHALARSDRRIQEVGDDRISGRTANAIAIAQGVVSAFGPQLEVLAQSSDSGVAALVTTVRRVAVEVSEVSTGDLRELRIGARAATALARECGLVLREALLTPSP